MTTIASSAPAADSASHHEPQWAAALFILVGASVWGISWYPYRLLAGWGLGSMLASSMTGAAAAVLAAVVLRRHFSTFQWSWLIPALGIAAGITNAGFVWGTVHGTVMRVLLLFYLTPVWTALLARLWLHERLGWRGGVLLALALSGAMMMLWSGEAGTPWPGSAAEWAGLVAGLAFACNNVLSRLAGQRHPTMRPEMRTVVVFTGCALVGFPAALLLDGVRTVPAAFSQGNTWLLLAGMACVLVGGNAMVQRGLQRLPANRAALLMLFEIVVAAVSSSLLTAERLSPQEMVGGACIILAGALSGLSRRK
ncbi:MULTISPECIES: DMT family transporter [Ralstonia]|uniref:DMT family transporter n=1 Tax=Ralstonia mojiangensis TaxID=2953895 RepID=A0AAE3I2Q3_9RALS|nr:DMT family transporter [Ralstonia mojiangensis]MCO5412592.1 DMT family transporter [Ralstonia mojiangensis]MCT7296928.1 DMT family transporter [Ralstonia mojiangensis]MCT7309436.1 DMT family transporter [Ralstonia mojiangensis]MCT7316486.1 DMT family transporter [Ralstonia mojiangensis]MCT7328297.1 DMT family transporter [Ralstonia mojiangensis]